MGTSGESQFWMYNQRLGPLFASNGQFDFWDWSKEGEGKNRFRYFILFTSLTPSPMKCQVALPNAMEEEMNVPLPLTAGLCLCWRGNVDNERDKRFQIILIDGIKARAIFGTSQR